MFSYEFCELLRNTNFVDDLQATGSETPVRGLSSTKLQAWPPEGL